MKQRECRFGEAMDKGSLVISYTIRCCSDHADGSWRFYLRQVQTGEEKYFATLEDVHVYIKSQLIRKNAEVDEKSPGARRDEERSEIRLEVCRTSPAGATTQMGPYRHPRQEE